MSYKTCLDCGCRIYEYGCVNCNEQDYIDMQNDFEYDPLPRPSDSIKINDEEKETTKS